MIIHLHLHIVLASIHNHIHFQLLVDEFGQPRLRPSLTESLAKTELCNPEKEGSTLLLINVNFYLVVVPQACFEQS